MPAMAKATPTVRTLDFASPGPVTVRCRLMVDHYWFIKKHRRNGEPAEFPPFKAGDCTWLVSYYPNGRTASSANYISISITGAGGRAVTATDDEPVRARVSFSLLDGAGEPVPSHSLSGVWDHTGLDEYGFDLFIHKEFLESSEYLVGGDQLTIECVVSVDRTLDLQRRLSLDPDVTFNVAGEVFCVHSCVLAPKSPVFQAELAVVEGTLAVRTVDDMLPQVFKNMLHFAYTDWLPETMMTGPEEEESIVMAERLLVAADRFDMQELKLICGQILSRDIDVNTVTKKLRLAVHHQCHNLRDACIEFLGDPPVLEAVMALAIDDDFLELVAQNCPWLLKEMWAYEDDPMQDELAMMCL